MGKWRKYACGTATVLFCAVVMELEGRVWAVETQTPEEWLTRGLQSYQMGQYAQAAEAWVRLIEFAESEELPLLAVLERRLLPLLGYALYRCEQYHDSLQYLQRYLEQNHSNRVDWVPLLIGKNKALTGDVEGALSLWSSLDSAADGMTRILSLWYQMEQLLLAGRSEDVKRLLEQMRSVRGVAEWVYTDMLLRTAMTLKDLGQYKEAVRVLLMLHRQHAWKVDPYGQTRMALELAGALLQEEDTTEVLWLLRRVMPAGVARDAQDAWVTQVREWLSSTVQFRMPYEHNPLWMEYGLQLYQRARSHQQAIVTDAGDTDPFHLIYAQVLMREKRWREAWIVLEEVALGEEYAHKVRQQAHHLWIVTACRLAHWQAATLLIESYADWYPDSHTAVEVSYMMVQVYSGEGKYGVAIDLLGELIRSYPDHSMQPYWHYHRGYLRMRIQQYESAREDFSWVLQRGKSVPQYYECLLWSGLSRLFENNLDLAADVLRVGLREIPSTHPLHPDYLYWLASVEYSCQHTERAESLLADYLQHYPLHFRVDEAIALMGDLRMRQADFTAALSCLRSIQEDSFMYPHAVMRIAEILQHRGETAAREQHLLHYVQREAQGACRRVAEALRELERSASDDFITGRLLPCYLAVLEQCGPRHEAAEVLVVLKNWVRLLKQRGRLIPADQIERWLTAQESIAQQEEQWVWYGRLILLRVLWSTENEEAALYHPQWLNLQAAPIHDLDREIVARLGVALLLGSRGDEARRYLEYVLEETGDPEATLIACYGMSRLLWELQDYREIMAYSNLVDAVMPEHPLAVPVKMLQIESCLVQKEYTQAIQYSDQVLQNRRYRGRVHAQCLLYKATAYAAMEDDAAAMLCYQRVTSIYRAYGDLVVLAYQESARLLERSGNLPAALEAWQQVVDWQESDAPTREDAEAHKKRLTEAIRAIEEKAM